MLLTLKWPLILLGSHDMWGWVLVLLWPSLVKISHYIQSYGVFSENQYLTPYDPWSPKAAHPVSMVISYFMCMSRTLMQRNPEDKKSISHKNHLFDPMRPRVTFEPTGVTCHVGVRVSAVMTKFGQDRLLSIGVFSENQYLTRVTPCDPGSLKWAHPLSTVISYFICISRTIMQCNPEEKKHFP